VQGIVALFDKATRLRLIESISHFNQVATNARGTHVLQGLLKQVSSRAEEDAILTKIETAGVSNLAKN